MTRGRTIRGFPWSEARLVEVTGTAPNGVPVTHPYWPLPLDGLLAGESRRRRLGRAWRGSRDHHTEILPVVRFVRGLRQQWVWYASALLNPDVETETRWRTSRADHAALQVMAGTIPKTILDQGGRFKAWRLPRAVAVCSEPRWRAIGDPAGIADLLDGIHAVGDGHNTGEGTVTKWRVADHGPTVGHDDPLRWLLWPDGWLTRPVPVRAAVRLGVEGADMVPGTHRPPYFRPPPVPDLDHFQRAARDLIAPWTPAPDGPIGRVAGKDGGG